VSCVRVVSNSQLLSKIDLFLNINKIPYVRQPVLIFHGEKDRVISFEHGKELYKLVPESLKFEPQWVKDADHNNVKKIIKKR
jgi:fermentation-respiration switch protein FrsA (DUF1100 family)